MALPSRQILEDPAWQRRMRDGLLGYPRKPWQHVLCWLGFRRRVPPAGFPAFGSFGHRMIRDVRARGRYDQRPLLPPSAGFKLVGDKPEQKT